MQIGTLQPCRGLATCRMGNLLFWAQIMDSKRKWGGVKYNTNPLPTSSRVMPNVAVSLYVNVAGMYIGQGLFFVIEQLQSLFPIERETGVAGNQDEPLGDGVGDDDVVAGVFVTVLDVRAQAGIGEHVLLLDRQHLNEELVFNGAHHVFGGFPSACIKTVVVIADYQLAHGLGTHVEQGIRLVERIVHVHVHQIGVGGQVDEDVGVQQIAHRLRAYRQGRKR